LTKGPRHEVTSDPATPKGIPRSGLLWNRRIRLVAYVFGGLLVLQRSDTLDSPKLVYFAVATATVLSSAWVAWRHRDEPGFAVMRPWIAISLAFAAMIAISLPVALSHGVAFTPWLRAVAPYGLFAAAPIVALDARRAIGRSEAIGWMILAATLAASSFSIYWVQHRQIADLGIEPPVLPSAQLAFAGFALAVAFAFGSSRSGRWAVLSGLILGAILITGARTTLLLLGVPAVLAVVAGRCRWKTTAVAIGIGALTTTLVLTLTIFALSSPSTSKTIVSDGTSAATARPGLIGEHLGSVTTVLADTASGQSLHERLAQTEAAFVAFAGDLVLGSGPGQVYSWTDSSGRTVDTRTLDTPLMIAAEFGLLGIAVLIGLVAVFAWFIRYLYRTVGPGPELLGFIGISTTFALTSLLGPPMDDKGAAFALCLLITVVLAPRTARTADVSS
jgi:hypothetical protein